jgi:hypothetical protein
MALKRRNAEASKDAAVRFLCSSSSLRVLTNTLSGRVRQHPPQACCRGQVPAAGDEEASCFLHAQVNLPSHRRVGWVKLQGWLAKDTQDMQVNVYKVKSHVHANIGFEGVGIWSSNEYHRGHTKAFRSPFCEQMLFTTFPTMVSQKKLLTRLSSLNSPWEYVAFYDTNNWISFVLHPDLSLVSINVYSRFSRSFIS